MMFATVAAVITVVWCATPAVAGWWRSRRDLRTVTHWHNAMDRLR